MATKNIPIEAKNEDEDCNIAFSKIDRNGQWVTQCSVVITNTNGMIQTSNFILEDLDFSELSTTLFELKQVFCFLRNTALTNLGYS